MTIYRALESERADALFHDPFARRLAGKRGAAISARMSFPENHAWSYVVRTHLFDQFIADQVNRGVRQVINLAAGLDTRPYRMTLPAELSWVEVDLPGLIEYKNRVLSDDVPTCQLERVALDLRDRDVRRELFERFDTQDRSTLVVCEGLLVYFTADQVRELADDISSRQNFHHWLFDLASPMQLRILRRKIGDQLDEGGAVLQFGPEQGVDFFRPLGWQPRVVKGLLKTAAQLKRLTPWMRLLALIPEPKGAPGWRPWSGVCLMTRHEGGA